jgi:transcriptional regulator with XRE-family HTH domain
LKTYERVLADDLRDPEFQAEWDRTQLAQAVALRVIDYRVKHGITQTELARRVGLRQPAVARLEAGDHQPSLATLSRLSHALGIEFHIDITPDSFGLSA